MEVVYHEVSQIKRKRVISETNLSINDFDTVYWHPDNEKLGERGLSRYWKSFQRISDSTVVWSSFLVDAIEYMVGALRAFCDKSVVTFCSDSVIIYPLHLILFSFSNMIRVPHTNSYNSITANFPYDFVNINGDNSDGSTSNSKMADRIDLITAIYAGICLSSYPLELVAVKGFSCCTKNSYNTHMHTILASYVADGSEQKSMVDTKRKVLTAALWIQLI